MQIFIRNITLLQFLRTINKVVTFSILQKTMIKLQMYDCEYVKWKLKKNLIPLYKARFTIYGENNEFINQSTGRGGRMPCISI